MATSTVISNARTGHRTARIALNGYHGTLALDWANGISLTFTSSTAISTGVIDASNDRIVFVTPGPATGCFITVGTSPTASTTAAAGNLFIGVGSMPVPVYVPAGMAISAAGGINLMAIPALIASDPG
jgi:hypothetical protein